MEPSHPAKKIQEFLAWFSGPARLSLHNHGQSDNEEYIYLLLALKKQVKFALNSLSRQRSDYKISCRVCDFTLVVEPGVDLWDCLQLHEHFEESLIQGLNGNFECNVGTPEEFLSETLQNVHLNREVSVIEKAPEIPKIVQASTSQPDTNLNDFRFNFEVSYDQRVEEALYPHSLMSAVKARDKLSEYSVQRVGYSRATCLLCPCTLVNNMVKINNFAIKNHTNGQRHRINAQTPLHLNSLTEYHTFWKSQTNIFQSHQVYFLPELSMPQTVKCTLCHFVVHYNAILSHITQDLHKDKVLKIFNAPDAKKFINEYYLMDMQVAVYNIIVPNEATGAVPRNRDNKNGYQGRQICKIVKCNPDKDSFWLPQRFCEHLKLLTLITANAISCKACNVTFSSQPLVIKYHITSKRHKEASEFTHQPYTFFCDICTIHFDDEISWEEHFSNGPTSHHDVPESRKKLLAEYECETCLLVFFGDELTISRHRSNGRGQRKKAEFTLPSIVMKLFKSNAFVETEATKLVQQAKEAIQDRVEETCDDLEKTISDGFPNCKAHPFGSRIAGLGNSTSDLDVFLDIGGMYLGETSQDALAQRAIVKKVTRSLRMHKEEFGGVLPIEGARTPIVKLCDLYTKVDCDVSFRHGLGVENTKFISFCIEMQPITQPFILCLKKWSDFCKFKEYLPSYALGLMAIFYLQINEFLLSVKQVRIYNNEPGLVIDGWETIRYTVSGDVMAKYVKPYPFPITHLLRGFFDYFANFDYTNNVVCPLLATTVPRAAFAETAMHELPPEMWRYVQRMRNENAERFRGLSPFCVQDPFDLSHNLTKALQTGTLTKLQKLCALSRDHLDSLQ